MHETKMFTNSTHIKSVPCPVTYLVTNLTWNLPSWINPYLLFALFFQQMWNEWKRISTPPRSICPLCSIALRNCWIDPWVRFTTGKRGVENPGKFSLKTDPKSGIHFPALKFLPFGTKKLHMQNPKNLLQYDKCIQL